MKLREEALRKFITGDIDVLVCTNVAARGLNIKGVKMVSFFGGEIHMRKEVHGIHIHDKNLSKTTPILCSEFRGKKTWYIDWESLVQFLPRSQYFCLNI